MGHNLVQGVHDVGEPCFPDLANMDLLADIAEVASKHADAHDIAGFISDGHRYDERWLPTGTASQRLIGKRGALPGSLKPCTVAILLGPLIITARHIDTIQVGGADQVHVRVSIGHRHQQGLLAHSIHTVGVRQ